MRFARLALATALLVSPAALFAQNRPVGPVQPRVNQLIIYGDDPCPQSGDDEIIVCARLPEEDRYRIPPNLRHDLNDARNGSWVNRATELSYVGRTGTDSCSTVGAGGFTGCMVQMINAARAERTSNDQVDWNALIEAARQQRLSTIDQRARDAEENEHPNSRVIYNSGTDQGPQ